MAKEVLQSGIQGAAAGASIGTAVNPGIGTAIGAGVGFLGGALLAPGESEYEAYTAEQLAELKRRQELGLLGLTPEEEAVMRARLQGQMSAARRETQEQMRQAAVGLDPAAFMRGAAQAEGEAVKASQESEQQIIEANLAKQQMEERQIYELLAIQYDADAAAEAQMYGAVGQSAEGISQAMMAAGSQQADREQMLAMLAFKYNMNPADVEESINLMGGV